MDAPKPPIQPAPPSPDADRAARARQESKQLRHGSQVLNEEAEALKNAFDQLVDEARELGRRSTPPAD